MVPLSVPLSLILRKVNARYESGKKEYQQNHLLNIDDLKLFSKSEDQIDTFWELFMFLALMLWWSLEWNNVEFLPLREGK